MLWNSSWCVVDIGLCTKCHPTTYLLTNDSCHVHVTYGDISVKDLKDIGIHFTGHALCALNSSGFGVTVKCLTFRCCRHWKTPGTLIDMWATASACKTRVTIDRAPMHEDLCACMILWAAPCQMTSKMWGKKHRNSKNLGHYRGRTSENYNALTRRNEKEFRNWFSQAGRPA